MTNYKPLDNTTHAALRVMRRHGAEFGDGVNQTIVFPSEFSQLHREYPIFFRKDEKGQFFSIALLGLDRGQNLFLQDPDWNARYVPAMHRKGPFRIAQLDQNGQDPVIEVDLDDERVGTDEGETLFLPQGGLSPFLQYMVDVLRLIQVGAAAVAPMFDALTTLNLLEPVTLQLKINATTTYSVPDLYSIDEEKFAALNAEELKSAHDSGLLALCFWILSSRENVSRLVEWKLMNDSAP